ncbi:MAG: Hpt domain-containing protein, partial [Planctomycetota bacterium]
MADNNQRNQDMPADDMAEFLSVYIDETGEQCDQFVSLLLALETEPRDARRIGEAFRLIHTIKGSAALIGLDSITSLAHHLESHFERLRSGSLLLDGPTIELALRCIDYFRLCNDRLRQGEKLTPVDELTEAVKRLAQTPPATAHSPAAPASPPPPAAVVATLPPPSPAASVQPPEPASAAPSPPHVRPVADAPPAE